MEAWGKVRSLNVINSCDILSEIVDIVGTLNTRVAALEMNAGWSGTGTVATRDNHSLLEAVMNRRWWVSGTSASELSQDPFKISKCFKEVVLDRTTACPLNPFTHGSYTLSAVTDSGELKMLSDLIPMQFITPSCIYKFESAQRVQNPTLQSVFRDHAPDSGHMICFHGSGGSCDDEAMDSILAFGFAPQLCKTGAFGPGTYFAKDIVPSLEHYGHYHVGNKTMSIIMTACALEKTLQFKIEPTDPLIPEGYGAFDIGGDVIVIQDYRLAYPAYVLSYTMQPVHE
jgi:hypothetical protein